MSVQDYNSKITSIKWALLTFLVCAIGLAIYFAYQWNTAKQILAQGLGTDRANPQFEALLRACGDNVNSFGLAMATYVGQNIWVAVIAALVIGLIVRWLSKPAREL